jgi:hypothetical protein
LTALGVSSGAQDGVNGMWGRKPKDAAAADAQSLSPLKEAIHQARVDNVIVDLRDAELARLELLNEALNPLFAEVPPEIDLFDRGISRGETPRLWIDALAHVAMGRDKRLYRFLHDSRMGRRVLAESYEVPDIVPAVTTYVARRLVERQRALEADPDLLARIFQTRWRGTTAGTGERSRCWRLDFSPARRRCHTGSRIVAGLIALNKF